MMRERKILNSFFWLLVVSNLLHISSVIDRHYSLLLPLMAPSICFFHCFQLLLFVVFVRRSIQTKAVATNTRAILFILVVCVFLNANSFILLRMPARNEEACIVVSHKIKDTQKMRGTTTKCLRYGT